MDQTTDTTDLTETEKYLFEGSEENFSDSDSDSDTENVGQDALLGGIRSGLSAITRTARKSLSTCKSNAELDDEIQKIEKSSLKLLKLEKSFLKTASIVSDVIEDLVPDYEDDEEENIQLQFFHGGNGNACLTEHSHEKSLGAAGDASSQSKPVPYIFQITEKNLASVVNFKEKLSKEFQKRLGTYENTLTDSQLKRDKKFLALLDQIKMGRQDAEISMKKSNDGTDALLGTTGKKDETENSSFLSSIPYSTEEMLKYQYTPYNEDDDMDHSVLPTIDPISKNPINFPVRNKYCNHVFDKDSIFSHIASNPPSTCPVHMCRNARALQVDHFVTDAILTSHVRRKNNLE